MSVSHSGLSIPLIRSHKRRAGRDPLVMVTAYDAPGAAMADRAGVDMILVGDSLAMVVLGHEDTLGLTVPEMAHHVAAVRRARPRCPVVADMPWMSYHLSPSETLANAAVLIRAGAQAVKLEGGRRRLPMIDALLGAEIQVMGHLGLTPQSVHRMGGFRVQATQPSDADILVDAATALAEAGCFALVLEGLPSAVAQVVTAAVSVPTIGIGAGPHCDGQVLVYHDLLGLRDGSPAAGARDRTTQGGSTQDRPTQDRATANTDPRFVRRYAELAQVGTAAISAWADDVRTGGFPSAEESYRGGDALVEWAQRHRPPEPTSPAPGAAG